MSQDKGTAQPAATERIPDSAPRRWLAGCFLIVVLLFCVPITVGVSAYVWKVVLATGEIDRSDREDRDDRNRVDLRLVNDILDAGVTPEHSLYFSKVCSGVANRLDVDREVDEPVFTQRKEVIDLLRSVGSLAVAGVDGVDYRRLPGVIEAAFDEVWEVDDDGKLKGGPLNDDDRDETVDRWRALAGAFGEVAQ